MNFSNLFLILFSVFASNAYAARMSILSPTELALKFTDDINFSTAHFGNVPYGAHLVGDLVLANPITACTPLEHFAGGDDYTKNVVAVVKRGGCRISIKTRHAQQAGAKILLIVADRNFTVADWFGHEHGDDDIHIPTIMIQQSVGEEFIKYLQEGKLQKGSQDPIAILNFPTVYKLAQPRLDFWYSAADIFGTSYHFIRHIRQIVKDNGLKFVPHWFTWTSGTAKKHHFVPDDPNCVSGGRYCAPDPDDQGPLTGADVVYEDLRQACIQKTGMELWWDYTTEFAKECSHVDNLRKCGEEALGEVASSNDRAIVKECVEESWNIPKNEATYNERFNDNKVLAGEKELQNEYHINSFPALFINYEPYNGNLDNLYDILKEACNKMEPLNDQCKGILGVQNYVAEPVGSHTSRIVSIMIIMSVVALVIFYFCRRMVKRENKDMSMQVGGMVSRYLALTEISGKDAENDS